MGTHPNARSPSSSPSGSSRPTTPTCPHVGVERVRDRCSTRSASSSPGCRCRPASSCATGSRRRAARPTAPSSASGFKTTPPFATLVNGAAVARARESTTSRPSAATPPARSRPRRWRVGEKLGALRLATSSLAWIVGWEVIGPDVKPASARVATSSSTADGSTRASRRRWVSLRSRPSSWAST